MTADSSGDDTTYCDTIRKQIEHEDNLVVNRLSWLMASQAFLFTAYAIVVNGPTARTAAYGDNQEQLIRLLPVLGISCCVLIYLGVIGAAVVMARLRTDLARRIATSPVNRPPIQGTALTRSMGMAAPLLL